MKCLYVEDFDKPDTIREVEADFRKNDTAVLNGDRENVVYSAYLYPLEARDELVAVCTERQRLKAAYDKSIALVYQLRNKHTGWAK